MYSIAEIETFVSGVKLGVKIIVETLLIGQKNSKRYKNTHMRLNANFIGYFYISFYKPL